MLLAQHCMQTVQCYLAAPSFSLAEKALALLGAHIYILPGPVRASHITMSKIELSPDSNLR